MDKIKINNQIVSLRKFVKQAKVRVLNKLAKDVKLFQNKKGNDAQLEKYKRKAERLLAEIDIIKKILPDIVSKKVLVKEKDWKSILANKDATMQDRSLAMVANCDKILNEVEKFHETNPNLVKKIPRLLLQWEKKKNEMKSQSRSKKVRASEIKQNKKAHRKGGSKQISPENYTKDSSIKDIKKKQNLRNNFVQTLSQVDKGNLRNESDFNESESESAVGSNSDGEFAVDSNHERQLVVDSYSESELAADSDSDRDFAVDSNSDQELTVTRHAEHDSKLTRADTLGSARNLKSIKTLNIEELMGLDEIPIEDECIEEDSNTVSTELKNDPFFLGRDNVSCSSDKESGHERVPKLNRKNITQHSQKSFRGRAKLGNPMHRGERQQFPGKNMEKNDSKRFSNDGNQSRIVRGKPNFRNNLPKKHDDSSFKKNFNQSSFPKQEKFQKNKLEEKPLHPSWEAKRKLNQSQSDSSVKAKRTVF